MTTIIILPVMSYNNIITLYNICTSDVKRYYYTYIMM